MEKGRSTGRSDRQRFQANNNQAQQSIQANMPEVGDATEYDSKTLHAVLKGSFGHDSFRPYQEHILEHVLRGEDVFATLPTGGGKSLLYQLPAVMGKGVTVVVSPLISLMQDQVRSLAEAGIPAACVNSSMNRREQEAIYDAVVSEKLKLVYVSPERLSTKEFRNVIDGCEVDRFVVDEAHCVSMWGHDFRPSYMKIAKVKEELFPDIPMLALTATAPVRVVEDILDSLNMEDAWQYHADVDRPNIELSVKKFRWERERQEHLLRMVGEAYDKKEPTIVYCARIASAEMLSELASGLGLSNVVYHGKMEAEERTHNQQMFFDDVVPLLFATRAFGMGVDKPNIRNVIHFELAESLESYYQEVGRAGRDGKPAQATMLYLPSDRRLQKRFIDGAAPTPDTLLAVYRKMASYIKAENRDLDVPFARHFPENIRRSLARPGTLFYDQVHSALAVLEEQEIVRFDAGKVYFLVKPGTFEPDEFPISIEMMDARRSQRIERLKTMLFYAREMDDPRQIILDHFRHNSVAPRASKLSFLHGGDVAPESSTTILQAVIATELTKKELANYLSGEGKDRGELFGSMKPMKAREVEFAIEHVESIGYIKTVPTGAKNYLVPTEKGSKFLDVMGVELEEEEITTYKELRPKLRTDLGHALLERAFQSWFEDKFAQCEQFESMWKLVLPDFLTDRFEVLDKTYTGEQILAHYYRTTAVKVSISHAVGLLNRLFENKIPISDSY